MLRALSHFLFVRSSLRGREPEATFTTLHAGNCFFSIQRPKIASGASHLRNDGERAVKLTVFFLALFLSIAVSAEDSVTAPAACAPPDPRAKVAPWEAGLSLQNLFPNSLVDFDTSLLGYGPTVTIPWGRHGIQLGGIYGFSGGLTLHLLEAGYRLQLRTPFLSGFALMGAHYLHYSFENRVYDLYGGNLGLGILQDLSDNFSMNVVLRMYIQKRSIITVGGGFTFLL